MEAVEFTGIADQVRPLRIISRQSHLKLVVSSLVRAIHKSLSVLLVGFFLILTLGYETPPPRHCPSP